MILAASGAARHGGAVIKLLSFFAFAALLGACCSTGARISVAIGSDQALSERVVSSVVVVCPGEEVSIGWVTQEAQSAELTDFGSVSVPSGFRTFTAGASTKEYVITAKGADCNGKATANVVVASPGTPFVFSATQIGSLNNFTLAWESVLQKQFYSEKVKITSIRLNAPATISGWSVRKVDTNGSVRDFLVTNVFSTPWSMPLQLAGTWTLVPKNPGELDPKKLPPLVELQVTLTCEE